MVIRVHLPDEIGTRAKAEDVDVSRVLSAALIAEFKRMDAATKGTYTGRFSKTLTGSRETGEIDVSRTADGRVLVFEDGPRLKHWVMIEDPEEELREVLEPEEYTAACEALGIEPAVEQ